MALDEQAQVRAGDLQVALDSLPITNVQQPHSVREQPPFADWINADHLIGEKLDERARHRVRAPSVSGLWSGDRRGVGGATRFMKSLLIGAARAAD